MLNHLISAVASKQRSSSRGLHFHRCYRLYQFQNIAIPVPQISLSLLFIRKVERASSLYLFARQ
jgi:hypothetical protein